MRKLRAESYVDLVRGTNTEIKSFPGKHPTRIVVLFSKSPRVGSIPKTGAILVGKPTEYVFERIRAHIRGVKHAVVSVAEVDKCGLVYEGAIWAAGRVTILNHNIARMSRYFPGLASDFVLRQIYQAQPRFARKILVLKKRYIYYRFVATINSAGLANFKSILEKVIQQQVTPPVPIIDNKVQAATVSKAERMARLYGGTTAGMFGTGLLGGLGV